MRRISLSLAAALLLVAVLAPASAGAFSVARTDSGQFMRWTVLEVGYYIDADGSDDISNDSDLTAIRTSFQSWVDVTCSYLTFRELGTTSVANVVPTGAQPNGKNELVWVEGSSWQFGYNTLGVTSPLGLTNGQIIEADIAFNGYLQRWTTSNSTDWQKTDVESVAVHEIGHLFGLQHNLYFNESDPPTMAPYVDPYHRTRSLAADDRMAICFLYPQSGEYTCSSDSQCPYILDVNRQTGEEYYADKLDCVASQCDGGDIGPQPGPPGVPCQSAYDCASYFCVANPTDGSMRCRTSCRVNDPSCRASEECYALSGNTGACMPPDVIPDTPKVPVGESCTRDSDCESNVCVMEPDGVSRVCRSMCTAGGIDCLANEICASLGDGRSACMPGAPAGPRSDGSPCDAHEDCRSGLCYFVLGAYDPSCRSECDPVRADCPTGWECVTYGVADVGICMARRGATGTGCLTGADCTTGMCRNDVCVQSCTAAVCPCGFQCTNDPELRTVCVPDAAATCFPVGASCDSDAACTSGLCVGGLCRAACKVLGAACPAGQACVHRGDSSDGACVTPGLRTSDQACDGDLQCASLLCAAPTPGAQAVCLDVCGTPGAACDASHTCEIIQGFRFFGVCLAGGGGGGGGGTGGADAVGGVDTGSGGGGSGGGGADGGDPSGGAGPAGADGGGGGGSGGGSGGCAVAPSGGGFGPGAVAPAALLLLLLGFLRASLRRRRTV